jgi:hypothetical protein
MRLDECQIANARFDRDLVLDAGLKKELDEPTDEYRRGDAGR